MRDYGRGYVFPESRFGIPHRDPAEDEPWPYPDEAPEDHFERVLDARTTALRDKHEQGGGR